MNKHKIIEVKENSIGWEVGIEPGDILISIDGKIVSDALDYYYLLKNEYIEVSIIKKDINEEWVIEIEKDVDEDLGLTFENSLMDSYKSCSNQCIFCFIDQLPSGLRDTLYFKDDDSRLSFLQGNYITFTNMKESDVDRLIQYRMEPVNISIHTMNMELRKEMLKNPFASRLEKYMDKLYNASLTMNGQIVLCKGINDGEELENTIEKLTKYIPYLQSVSIVPVGLSKHRDNLTQLEAFTKEDANKVIETVKKWQDILLKEHGTHFIHAGDEFYFLADKEVPEEETYDGYLQYENGVGMTRLLMNEFNICYNELVLSNNKIENEVPIKKTIVTGVLIAPIIEKLVNKIKQLYPNLEVQVCPIVNHFFGEEITVSGLLTGTDIIEQLKGKELGESLILPSNLLKTGETILLDDVTIEDIEKALNISIQVVDISGEKLINAILDKGVNK